MAQRFPVRGFVAAETIGKSWLEYELENARRQLLLLGRPYDVVDQYVRVVERCQHRFAIEKQSLPAWDTAWIYGLHSASGLRASERNNIRSSIPNFLSAWKSGSGTTWPLGPKPPCQILSNDDQNQDGKHILPGFDFHLWL
ncbi:MAG TPA: hypothetical protein VKY85_16025 [Candidatus Angelobacter sp.]|nr:hypothetical protein [Candidatus Angelobacter sp.]